MSEDSKEMTALEVLTTNSISPRLYIKDQTLKVQACSIMGSKFTKPLETATRKKIDQMLINLGWNVDEDNPNCNVFTERAKTVEQDNKFEGNDPDYVLYQSNSDVPIAIIEAKRKGQSIDNAISDAIEKYAKPLGVKIIFADDGAFFKSWHVDAKQELYVDGQVITQLISEKKLLKFLKEGNNIDEVTPDVKHTREELIKIFRWANDLLRKEGLRNLDRFVEFSNILFIKIISEIEDDRENNGLERQLDKHLCWDSFCELKDPKTMLNYINNTVLRNGLAREYNHSDDIFQEKLKIKNPNTVKEIVDKLSNLKLLNTESEIKGDAFEYFLKSLASGNDLGEYFTPRHIVKLMVTLVNPKFGNTVFDPCCGTGGFLIEAFRHIQKGIDEKDKDLMRTLREHSIFGIELTDTYKIAKMNMIITGDGHNNIIQADVTKNDYWKHKDLKKVLEEKKITGFQIILSNIPYSQTTDYGHLYPIPTNDADSIFVQQIILALKKGGRCGVIVPEGFLFKSEHKKVREYLLQKCNVESVISLPAGVFLPYTMSKTDILIFEKGIPTKKVWFYVIENDGYELATKRKRISGNNIPNLIAGYDEKKDSEKSWSADFEQIKKNDFILEAKTYKPLSTSSKHLTKFSKFLKEVKRPIEVKAVDYKQITVKLYGKGTILRGITNGNNILTKRQFLAKEGDLIVSKIDARNGAFAIIGKELDDAIVSGDFPLYEIDNKIVNPEYLNFFLKYYNLKDFLSKSAKGTTNRQRIDPDDFLNLEIPLPSLPIQNDIIERLQKQEIILSGLDNTLTSLKNGFIDQMIFENQDSIQNVPLQKFTQKKQYGMTRTVMPEEKGTPYIRITDIDSFGRINFEKLPEIKTNNNEILHYKVSEGDLLIARTGATIGKCTVIGKIREDIVFASYLIRFILDKNKVEPKYVMYYLLSNKGQHEVLKRANRTTNININADQLASIEIPIPKSLEEQRKIIKHVEEKIEFIEMLEKTRIGTRDIISSIINKTFEVV